MSSLRLPCSCACVLVVLVLVDRSSCLYEDQVGDVDWYKRFVGPVSYAAFDRSTQSSKVVVLASERGILAAVNSRTGALEWRHTFEQGEGGVINAILHRFSALISVSGGGSRVRSWSSDSGALLWEVSTGLAASEAAVYPLDSPWKPGAVLAAFTHTEKTGSFVLVAGGQVVGYSTASGEKLWSLDISGDQSSGVVPCLVGHASDALYVVTLLEGAGLGVLQIEGKSGKVLNQWTIAAPWLSQSTGRCVLSGGLLACLERERMDLYFSELIAESKFTLTMLPSLGVAMPETGTAVVLSSAIPHDRGGVAVRIGHTQWILDLHGNKPTVASVLEDTHLLETWMGGRYFKASLKFSLDRQLEVRIREEGRGERDGEGEGEGEEVHFELSLKMDSDRGQLVRGALRVFHKADKTLGCRILVGFEDHTLLMVQQSGAVAWTREEALASMAALEMLDLPGGQEAAIESFVSYAKAEGNPIKLAMRRLQLQLTLTKEFLTDLQTKGVSILQSSASESQLVRDPFNTHKLIVALADNGKLYGIKSRSGEEVWQKYIPQMEPFQSGELLLFVLRSTNHPPHPSLAVAIGEAKSPHLCEGSLLYTFDPLTGIPANQIPECLSYHVIQTLLLPTVDSSHSKILLLLSDDYKVHVLPSTPEAHAAVKQQVAEVHFYTLNAKSGSLEGLRVLRESALPFSTSPMWHTNLRLKSDRIASIVPKVANEQVNSQGRVLVDRSVQYKYLNPNLVAIATESLDRLKPSISVHLLDKVTGSMVHRTSHKMATGPVHMVHSENWLVYSYSNVKARRQELTVLELYNNKDNQTHNTWSSLSPPPFPVVIGQSYILPSHLLSMATTHTLRGITQKTILLGLHSGHIVSLSKDLLDPRRELVPTEQMREDGLPPYFPEIVLKPVSFLNYNQTVTGLKNIYTFPSGLESTCLVVASGLDLYYTRVTPSKQFDVLAEDFDYKLIASVLGALIVGTVILSRLSAAKSLKLAWT